MPQIYMIDMCIVRDDQVHNILLHWHSYQTQSCIKPTHSRRWSDLNCDLLFHSPQRL